MKRVAVIDCGTNTFNLLVADLGENGEWKTVFKMNSPVKLTPGGPSKSIAVNRIARAVDVMRAYYHHTINYEVQETYAFATSAFRSTENGRKLRDLIEERTKINVEIIDGDREAQLIFQGVVYSGLLDSSPALIMDIGGGSTEFIIANNEQQLWKKSFQIGVSRVFNRFNPAL